MYDLIIIILIEYNQLATFKNLFIDNKSKYRSEGSLSREIANVFGCILLVSEFQVYPPYNFHFQTYTFGNSVSRLFYP